jgi:SpoVK/Ycf46/Vps4 family AAA+-type ATPase
VEYGQNAWVVGESQRHPLLDLVLLGGKTLIMDLYADSREHLLDELRRIDLLIQRQVVQFRAAGRDPGDAFRGLHISEEDVDGLLAGAPPGVPDASHPPQATGEGIAHLFRRLGLSKPPPGDSPQARAAHPPLLPSPDLLHRVEEEIARRKAASLAQGVELRLENLAARFGLGDLERDALLVCLAPELDLRYERLYAYLQDDVTRKRPTVDLALSLLCSTFEDKLAARVAFAPDAPLVHHHLLEALDGASEHAPPLLARFLKVDDRIVDHVLGHDGVDARLRPLVRWAEPSVTWAELSLPEETQGRLVQLVSWYRASAGEGGPESLILFLHGPEGVGKRATAGALCREIGAWLLVVDVRELLEGGLPFETAVRLVFREAVLQQVPLYWDGFDRLLADEDRARSCRHILLEHLESLSGLTFLAGQSGWEPSGVLHGKTFVSIDLPVPPYPARRALWEARLEGRAAGPLDVHALANQFRFGPGQIRDAVATARNRALWRDPEHRQVTMDDLFAACRAHSHHRLGTLARHIRPVYTWDDIVLPPDQSAQLREICHAVRYRPTVYTEWGFERKLSRGKGVNALFTGPSGTGKTMATEIMAHDLGLDLYKIDLSAVVSKYIGETEKNLERIFREAQTSNAILFFDEADALFGKRSEVKDAHDRYANIEIAYLLQRMEEYEGIVILATNLKKNMDEAFVRRMQFTVEFPFPEEADRLRIWRKIWPAETPRGDDLDLVFMARQFRIAGGNIKNIALAAAFLAAADGRSVTMPHLVQATRREYQKMGKLCTQAEFGPYFYLVKG